MSISAKVNKNVIYIILHFILVWLLNFWGMCSKITCTKIRMKGIYGVSNVSYEIDRKF